MHLLHLLESWSELRTQANPDTVGLDAAVSGAVRCMRKGSYHTHGAVMFGTRDGESRARDLGFGSYDSICPLNGQVRHGVATLRRMLAHRPAPDRLIVWNAHLLPIAEELGVPVVWAWGPTAGDPAPLRAPAPATGNRSELRTRIGARAGDIVVAAADDPAQEADLWKLTGILSMLESLEIPAVGIAPTAAWQRGRGRRAFRAMGLTQGLVLVQEPVWSLAPAIDLAVVTRDVHRMDLLGHDWSEYERGQAAWAQLLAVERMMGLGVPTVSTWSIASPDAARPHLTARSANATDLAGRLSLMLEHPGRLDFVREVLSHGICCHDAWLADRLVWGLTASTEELAAAATGPQGAAL